MVQDIDDVVEVLRTVMPRHPEIRKVCLFGSFARGEQGPDSDVDLLAVPEGRRTYAQDFSMREDLRNALGRDVDVVTTLDGAPRYFVEQLRRDGVCIYGRN